MNSEDAMKQFDKDAQQAEDSAMQVYQLFQDSIDLRSKATKTTDALIALLRAKASAGAVAELRDELATHLTAYELFKANALATLAEAFVADADLVLCYKDICDNVSEDRLYEYELEMRKIDELVVEASSSYGVALIGTFDVLLMEYVMLELSNRDAKISQTFEQALAFATTQAQEASRRRIDRSRMNAAKEKQDQLMQLLHEGKRGDEAKQLLAEMKELSLPCKLHANRMAKYLANAAIAIMVAQLNIDEAVQNPDTKEDTINAMRQQLAQVVSLVHDACVSTSMVVTLNEIIASLPDELEWQVKGL